MSDLLARAAELVGIPSVSLGEAEIAGKVESILQEVPWLVVERVGNNVVARTQFGSRERVLLAGHLDTVPPADDGSAKPRVSGGALWGLGATDMKGGLAVMLDLARTLSQANFDLTYVFYAAEEIARSENGLLAVHGQRPELLAAEAAIVCEPTDGAVEAGCQGVLRAEVKLAGARAHVARPWMGRNAIHRAAPLLELISMAPSRTPEIDGCTYRESLQVVRIGGGVAGNVVPDSVSLEINYRFAPDLDIAAASEHLGEMIAPFLEDGGSFEITDRAPPAPPSLGHPLLARLVALSERPPVAKLGWTDVAFFAEQGIPAANFGPGDPLLAHTPGEFVTLLSLEHARRALGALLAH